MDVVTAQLAASLVPKRRYGVRVAGLGDSHTQRGFVTTGKAWTSLVDGHLGQIADLSPHMWASLLSGGAFRFIGAASHGGWTSQQIVEGNSGDPDIQSSLLNIVLASDADVVVVLMGTNDIGAGTATATTMGYIDTTVRRLLARGKLPVLCSVPPREASGAAEVLTFRTLMGRLNLSIARYAAANGLPFCDLYAALSDPDSTYKAGYNTDNFHMNAKGAREAGRALAATLIGWLTPTQPPLAMFAEGTGTTTYSRVGNPLMDDLDANSIVDGWTATAGAAVAPVSDGAIIGKWLRTLRAAATNTTMTATNTIPASAGDKLLLAARLRANVATVGGTFDVRLMSNPSTIVVGFAIADWSVDVPDGCVLLTEFTCPDLGAETALKLEARAKTADGASVDLAQLLVLNLTTAGIA